MRMLAPFVLALSLAAGPLIAQSGEDIRQIETDKSVAEATDALEQLLTDQGLTVFARVDHGAGAQSVEMDIGDSQLLIFGNPQVGTPAMMDNRLAGLVLPLKVLVFEDSTGQVHLAWQDPGVVLTEFSGIEEDTEYVQRMRMAIDNFASQAAAP